MFMELKGGFVNKLGINGATLSSSKYIMEGFIINIYLLYYASLQLE